MEEVITETLTTSGDYTSVSLGANQRCSGYILQARDESLSFKIKKELNSTNYMTVPAGLTLNISEVRGPGGVLFYGQAVEQSMTVEVLPYNK